MRLRAATAKLLPSLHWVKTRAAGCVLAKLPEYMAFHVFESTNWGDGTSSIRTLATMRGGELAYDAASFMLLGARAEEQNARSPIRKIKLAYKLVVELECDGKFAAWLNCETGEVSPHANPRDLSEEVAA